MLVAFYEVETTVARMKPVTLVNSRSSGGFPSGAATTFVESEMEDHELLRDYAQNQSEAAFAELVSRHC